MRLFILIILLTFSYSSLIAQGCCSGASGNPIAGGASTGVLLKNQIELSVNYQYNFSDNFYSGSNDTIGPSSFKNLKSNYLFLRTDYGLSKSVTLSIAGGYFIDKTKGGSKNSNTKGISDIIIFPRYNIYNKDLPFTRSEITIGLGMKIPIGSHTDTIAATTAFDGTVLKWDVKPPISQLSSGANDLILYSFFLREYKLKKIRVFANILHISKGYNSFGSKIGNYTSLAVYLGKTFNNKITSTIQFKREFIKQMIVGETEVSYGRATLEESSGSKKTFVIPQISYSLKSLSIFATYELPIYQYLNGSQIGSKNQFTVGLNYRFLSKKNEVSEEN